MSTFTYRAKTPDGGVVTGKLRAKSVGAVKASLAERDFVVEQVDEKHSILTKQIGRGRVSKAEVMHLTRQLAAFVRTGVPLLEAFEVVAEESPNPTMRRTLSQVIESLRSGWTLSEAMGVHQRVFPPYLMSAVRSAELTGRLDTVLEQVGRYMERDLDARRKVKAALTYPGVILGLSAVAVVVLSAVVLPRFTAFFASFDAELPFTTRTLMAISGFIATWWWALGGGLVALIVGTTFLIRSEAGRRGLDRLMLRTPVVGRIVRYALSERFCRMLSSMISAGVSLPDAMTATANGTGNTVYRDALLKAREEMIRGEGFARPIIRTGLFPGAINQIVRVGEDTGSLDEQLESAASFYELELDFSIKRMTTLFEPAAIIVMAMAVGFVALAMVQAMYGVLNQAGAV